MILETIGGNYELFEILVHTVSCQKIRFLRIFFLQQQGPNAPTPKKRKGNFKKSRLKLLKNKDVNQSSTSMISAPLGKTTL